MENDNRSIREIIERDDYFHPITIDYLVDLKTKLNKLREEYAVAANENYGDGIEGEVRRDVLLNELNGELELAQIYYEYYIQKYNNER